MTIQVPSWQQSCRIFPNSVEAKPVRPKVSEGGWVDFPLSTFCLLQSTLPLSMSLLCKPLVACWCVSYDNHHQIACFLPSLTTLHYYFILILCVTATADLDDDGRFVERGIYTDYVIVSKETSLCIADLVYFGVGVALVSRKSGWCA